MQHNGGKVLLIKQQQMAAIASIVAVGAVVGGMFFDHGMSNFGMGAVDHLVLPSWASTSSSSLY